MQARTGKWGNCPLLTPKNAGGRLLRQNIAFCLMFCRTVYTIGTEFRKLKFNAESPKYFATVSFSVPSHHKHPVFMPL